MKKSFLVMFVVVLMCSFAQADIVHRWSFNGDATDSVGVANATIYGNAVIAGNALDITANDESSIYAVGTNDAYASLPIQSTLSGMTDTMSIMGWIYWDSAAPAGAGYCSRVWDFGTIYNDSIQMNTHESGNTMANIRTSSADNRVTVDALSRDVWHQVAVTIDKGAEFKLYVDGVLAGETSCSLAPSEINALNCFLGRYSDLSQSSNSVVRMWDGKIDELRIWDDVISADDVSDMYAYGADVVPEPTTIALLGLGALGLIKRRRQ